MRIVSPYRPFPPEAKHHHALADFDWIAALTMMADSAKRACRCPVHVLTDIDTDLPLPMLKYQTSHRRLMLWSVEVVLRYLESDDFNQDTVLLDGDQLVYQNLTPWFTADLGVLVRPGKMVDKEPVLNGVQWFRHAAKDRLIGFYREALRRAEQMPEDRLVWGADTDALRSLIEPIAVGIVKRAGLTVSLIHSDEVLASFTRSHAWFLRRGALQIPRVPVVDFRGVRKPYMAPCYAATFGVRR